MAKSSPSIQEELLRQAKITNRLLVLHLKTNLGQMELIDLLSDFGLSAREVGELLGTTPATVAVTLQRLKTRKRTRKLKE